MDYHPTLVVEAKKGIKKGFSELNKDYWRLELSRKSEVLRLIGSLPIKHPEKKKLRQLMFEIRNEVHWSDVRDKVRALHAKITNDIKQCIEEAASVYRQNHYKCKDGMKFKRAIQI